ncbi:ubiquitin-like protein 4A [Corticium candelabrum]|uniref:ubiquitin-like protein 4A n=1 Tax=Corticium candelabrum TaxID=121492 RepID=UPI002E2725AE|nr:ubiquitin-like protein 4A [Corticium candelabrum]
MRVFVKQLRGGEGLCEVREDSNVADLKFSIEKEMGVAVGDQRLVFKGKILQGSLPLSQYGLSDGSKVHLTSKTRAPLVCRPDSGVQTAGLEQHTDLKSKECDVAAVDHMTCLRTFLLKYFNSEDADKVVQRFREEIRQRVAAMNLDNIERLATKRMASMQTREET